MSRNPWLDIPLGDYEAHMSLPEIGQAQLIAKQLAALIETNAPRSVAVAGCAGGNGFEHLRHPAIERVVGIDINPAYLAQTQQRYAKRIPGLELHVADIESRQRHYTPVELTYAPLVFEYVDVGKALAFFRRHSAPNATLGALLQLPHVSLAEVSASPYASLQKLAPGMHLVPETAFERAAHREGFVTQRRDEVVSPAGKRFSFWTLRADPLPQRAPS